MVPTIVLLSPIWVKLLPTHQTTFEAWAPLTSRTDAPLSRMVVEAEMKTKIAPETPWASRVMLVGMSSAPPEKTPAWYTPAPPPPLLVERLASPVWVGVRAE